MKNKLILWLSVLALIVLIAFMAKDLFRSKPASKQNVYRYDLDQLRMVDSSVISHKELLQIPLNAKAVHAIAVDQQDRIYIGGDEKLIVLDRSGKEIQQMKLVLPASCMAVADNGNILVGMKNRVDVRRSDGSLQNSFVIAGEKCFITSIAILGDKVFIADAGQKVIHEYHLNGEKEREIGNADPKTGIKGFVIPSPYFDLLIGRQGELWAVNPGRHALEAYNMQGEQISSWQRTSMRVEGFSGCCNPSNIAMLSNGSFVTAEKGIERVKIHLPSGDFKSVVAAPTSFDAGTRGIDLAVDSQDRILVLDPKRKMLRIFVEK